MALLNELTLYRTAMMRNLCSDTEIVKLVTNSDSPTVPARDLMYKNIFPYAYVPDTTKDVSTFICYRLMTSGQPTKTFKDITMYFYVFTHRKIIRTSNGLRTDLLASRIDEMFNGSLDLGLGRIKFLGFDDFSPIQDYHGLLTRYVVTDWNRPSINGDKKAGALIV